MASETFDLTGESAAWKLRRQLSHEGRTRYKERQNNPHPDREFLLRAKPKPQFEPERWDCPREEITLRKAAERFAEKVIRPSRTDKNYAYQKRQLFYVVGQWDEDTLISDITAADLAAFRDSLFSQGLTASTGNSYVDEIQRLLTACVELWGVLDSAPRIKRLPAERKQTRIISYEEEVRLLKASPRRLRRLLIFLLGTGVRKTDAINLTWDQVIFKKPGENRGRLRIWASKTRWEYIVPLATHVENMLRDMKAELPEDMDSVFTFIPKRDVYHYKGGLIQKRGIATPYKCKNADFQIARGIAGLKDVTIRSCRHTFASRLIEKNVPVYDVARLLGHQGLSTVMRYAHASAEHFDPVISILDRPLIPGVYDGDPQSRYEGML
ncbi:MAG: tyrosine-type recombinase/integrase [Alphaproteobacteria bacterium]|nr:tyrosine-type recombinase/integrase [Alphaproteobacteria bacterium]